MQDSLSGSNEKHQAGRRPRICTRHDGRSCPAKTLPAAAATASVSLATGARWAIPGDQANARTRTASAHRTERDPRRPGVRSPARSSNVTTTTLPAAQTRARHWCLSRSASTETYRRSRFRQSARRPFATAEIPADGPRPRQTMGRTVAPVTSWAEPGRPDISL